MKWLALCMILLLSAAFVCGEELDASMIGLVQVSSSAYSLVSSSGDLVELAASNCRTPIQQDPAFELMARQSASCTESGVQVYYQYYDFASEKWSAEQALYQCTIPSGLNCKASFPIKLGGNGTGEATQDLLKLRATCAGVDYTKTFRFRISHTPSTAEDNAVNKISSAETSFNNAKTKFAECGSCCEPVSNKVSSTQSKLDEAKNFLKECDLTKALSSGTEAFTLAKEAGDAVSQKTIECAAATQPTQPAQPSLEQPAQPSQPSTPPATQPSQPSTRPPTTPPAEQPAQPSTGQTGTQQKTCPILLVFPFVALLGFVAGRR